jgi:outer membrane protein assembly factor BamB
VIGFSMFAVTAQPFYRAQADDWPNFRGQGGSAVGRKTNLPTQWGPEKNIAWKVKVPGYGWSCPVVAGGKVFVVSAVAPNQKKPAGGAGMMLGFIPNVVYKWELHCLAASDGKTLWTTTIAEQKPLAPTNPTNGYASETPATDGKRVFVAVGGVGTVFAFDLAGKQVWKVDVGVFPTQFNHGPASSLALDNGRLFIQCDNERKSFLLAVDAKSGKEIWRTPRPERTSWSTPFVWKNAKRTEIVCNGNPMIRSYDPETGKQFWEIGELHGQVKATPVGDGELLVVGSGGGYEGGGFGFFSAPKKKEYPSGNRPLFAIRPGAAGELSFRSGEKSSEQVAWHLPTAGPSTASPLLYEGCIYIVEERGGVVSCYEAKSGRRHYKERIPGSRGFTASPWAHDGRVYCLDDSGTTHVLKAGPEFKVLSANPLDEMAWASPAIAGNAIYLRTVEHLFCLREAQR